MNSENKQKLYSTIRRFMDFPQKGINFIDISTVLKDKSCLNLIINDFSERYKDKSIDFVIGGDARGFIFGSAIAYKLGAGFVFARKPGKLPGETIRETYDLEYGSNSLEMQKDALFPGARVIIVDDLLATGGTAKAMTRLAERLDAEIHEIAFLIELEDLKGRELLKNHDIYSILQY